MGQPIPHLEAREFVLYDAIVSPSSGCRGHGGGKTETENGRRGRKERRREERDFIRGSNRATGRRDKDPTIQLPVCESLMADAILDFHAHSNTVTTPNVTSIENQPRYVRSFPVIYYRCHTSVILLHRPLITRTALCLVHTDRFKGIEQLRERKRERIEKQGLSIFFQSDLILYFQLNSNFIKKRERRI